VILEDQISFDEVKSKYTLQRMSNEHPLRGVITCLECDRKFTSRNTSKRVWKWNDKTKKLYPYYGCNNPDCWSRVNVNKHKLEKEFDEFVGEIHLPNWIVNLIDAVFEWVIADKKINVRDKVLQRKKIIAKKESRMNAIEKLMMDISNHNLISKLEDERSILESEIESLQELSKNHTIRDHQVKWMLDTIKQLFVDAVGIRHLWDPSLRELLLLVRFWNNIFYSKKEGLQTNGKGTLYNVLTELKDDLPAYWAKRATHKTKILERFKLFQDKTLENIDVLEGVQRQLSILNIEWDDKESKFIKLSN